MGIKSRFIDGTSYSADDMNKAFASLTTDGVSLHSVTTNPLVDINTAISNITNAGVDVFDSDSCKVTVSSGVYKVNKGVIFLSDGSSVEVDSDGYVIVVESGVTNYVYAKHYTFNNTVGIYVGTSAGGTGSVPLATISADGTITDTRVFAKSKISMANANLKYIVSSKSMTVSKSSGYSLCGSIDFNFAGFNMVVWKNIDKSKYHGFTDISDGTMAGGDYAYSDTLIKFQKVGSKLNIYLNNTECNRTIKFYFGLY